MSSSSSNQRKPKQQLSSSSTTNSSSSSSTNPFDLDDSNKNNNSSDYNNPFDVDSSKASVTSNSSQNVNNHNNAANLETYRKSSSKDSNALASSRSSLSSSPVANKIRKDKLTPVSKKTTSRDSASSNTVNNSNTSNNNNEVEDYISLHDATVSPLHTARSDVTDYDNSIKAIQQQQHGGGIDSINTNSLRNIQYSETNPFDNSNSSRRRNLSNSNTRSYKFGENSHNNNNNNNDDNNNNYDSSPGRQHDTDINLDIINSVDHENNDDNNTATPAPMTTRGSLKFFYNLRNNLTAQVSSNSNTLKNSNTNNAKRDSRGVLATSISTDKLNVVTHYDTLSASRANHHHTSIEAQLEIVDIYHQNSLSEIWLLLAVIIHSVIWGILLTVTAKVIPPPVTIILILLMIVVILLLGIVRGLVKKKRTKTRITHFGDGKVRVELSPEDESDGMSDLSIILLGSITVIEGFMFALYTATAAGSDPSEFNIGGYISPGTVVETLNFASITFLALHRTIRPANRVDPMRTILELEVVSVCWDALDGATLYVLLDTLTELNSSLSMSIRFLMAFWYLSVGCRIALMFCTHLPPDARLYSYVLSQPYFFSPNPTVDRSLSALRLRCKIILVMACSEFYAMAVRIHIWTLGLLAPLQQEMLLKNILFLLSVYSAYDMYSATVHRHWNSRTLGFGLKIPTRAVQLEIFRWMFCILYVGQGVLLSAILTKAAAPGAQQWIVNIFFDIGLVLFFYIYCRHVHVQNTSRLSRFWLFPQKAFVLFPGYLGFLTSALLMISMYAFRLPGLYFSATRLNQLSATTDGSLWSYDNALLIVNLSTITIACNALFWSVSYLLFHADFTACPDNYNAIHDPITNMVATATMTEGALDMLSCTALMYLAELHVLPHSVSWLVAIFSVLEVMNACQCFGLQAMLSGGKNDSPLDLVKWKAYLRAARFFIDLGVFLLRVGLWVNYQAVSSIFLIKNLYNLIHTVAQVERYFGGRNYAPATLFTSEVRPEEWYGMTSDEWRRATSRIQI